MYYTSSVVFPSTGIRRPIITFSLRPIKLSTLPSNAASVKTLVVSWKEDADNHESEYRADLVIPRFYLKAESRRPADKPYSELPNQLFILIHGYPHLLSRKQRKS